MLDSQSARTAILEADRLVRDPHPVTAPLWLFPATDGPAPMYTRADRDALEEYNRQVMARSRERMQQRLAAERRERGGNGMSRATVEVAGGTPAEEQTGPSGKYPTGAAAGTVLADSGPLALEEGQYANVSIDAEGFVPMYDDPTAGAANVEIQHSNAEGLRVHTWRTQCVTSDDVPLDGTLFEAGDRLTLVMLNDFPYRLEVNIEIRELIARPRKVD